MKKRTILVALLTIAIAGSALAHGVRAKFGGAMAEAGGLQFELVNKNGAATIHVFTDHGREVPTVGASGKMTVVSGTTKNEAILQASNSNTLEANSDAKLVAGAQVTATVTFADKKMITVGFISK
jgi:hypothetical protein